ncbi:MAG: HAD family hydrolase [Treponemataceae bacterium]|nr:HAD family hydrolase [Treponemataceae bacterium]
MKVIKIPQNLKTIIFDIDSTLYTNEEYAFEQVDCQVRRFASERGISDDEARKLVADFREKFARENGGKKISLSNTLLSFGVPIQKSVEWRRELLEPKNFLTHDERLQKTLSALSEKFNLICVTNNPVTPAKKTLVALGVESLFSDIIGLDTCNVSKPAREPFLLAAEKCGSHAQECLSVGDRYDLDISVPLELGMGGVLVEGVADVYRLPDFLQ